MRQLDALHQKMRDLMIDKLTRKLHGENIDHLIAPIDDLLNQCSAIECCDQCADIFCPWGEGLHFHHDGCPCCASHPDHKWNQYEADIKILARNVCPSP